MTISAENRTAAGAAAGVAAAMIAQLVASKAIRDAYFLTHWPVEKLPLVMAGASILSVAVVLGFTHLVVRSSPARVVPTLFVLHGLLYAGGWAVAQVDEANAAVIVYVHSASFGATVVSGFWSVFNERFDPHTAKRLIARIAGGATAGGVVGGVLAWQAGEHLELSSMLLLLTAVNIFCALGVRKLRGPATLGGRLTATTRQDSGFQVMRKVRYLRHVAVLVVLVTLAEACVDYVFKAEAKTSFSPQSLITFFAIFHAVVAVVTFGLQTVMAKRALERLGLAGTVATLPAVTTLGAAVAILVPGLWPIAALRGGGMAVQSSLYRSGYELLFTPLTPSTKRPTKTAIDVGADRLGTTLGSGVALAAIWLVPAHVQVSLLVFTVAVAVLGLVLSGALHRGYVAALADSLRRGSVSLALEAAEDATTRKTLADTAMALDRDKLLEQIAALRAKEAAADGNGDATEPEVADEPVEGADDGSGSGPSDPLAEAMETLRTGSAGEIRKVLKIYEGALPRELVPAVISLLAREDVHHDAIALLRQAGDSHIGQLTDALLNPSVDFAVRRRIPRVLGRCVTQRSVDGLMQGLADERFEVRYRCAVALYQLTEQEPALRIPKSVIFDAALREAELGEQIWRSQKVLDTSLDETSGPFFEYAQKLGHALEHVFTLLSLALEREPLQLAYRALATNDESLRGTGLEYLENVLPANIRESLWPYLGDQRVTRKSPREREVVVRDLLDSMSSMSIDLDAVRRAVKEHDSN